jgi:hypothetical protein
MVRIIFLLSLVGRTSVRRLSHCWNEGYPSRPAERTISRLRHILGPKRWWTTGLRLRGLLLLSQHLKDRSLGHPADLPRSRRSQSAQSTGYLPDSENESDRSHFPLCSRLRTTPTPSLSQDQHHGRSKEPSRLYRPPRHPLRIYRSSSLRICYRTMQQRSCASRLVWRKVLK